MHCPHGVLQSMSKQHYKRTCLHSVCYQNCTIDLVLTVRMRLYYTVNQLESLFQVCFILWIT